MPALTYAAVLALIAQPVDQGGCGIATCGPVPTEIMTRIVMHESGGNAEAWNVNRNRSVDCGVAQINSGNWAWLGLDERSCKNVCRNLAAELRVLNAFSSYATGSPCKGYFLTPPGAKVSYVEDMADRRFRAPDGIMPPPTAPPPPLPPKPISLVLHSGTARDIVFRR